MFSFHTKNIYLADLLDDFYDIHCHLLPGVDDGSPDREHSLRLLERMQGMGVKGLYMTPHIIHGAYDNRGEEELRQRFADFGYQGPLDIRLGAEYFIDDKFPEHLEGNPLTMNCRHVLVEFSINGYSLRAFDMLFEATLSGYEIILAHPERYAFVQANGKDKVINLIKQYKLQLNLLSLGEHQAHSLGLNVRRTRLAALVSAAALAGCAVSFAGLVGFVGLIVPHAVRALVGHDNRRVLAMAPLLGGLLVCLCDLLARTMFAPYEIPVGIVLSLLGGPFFVYLILRRGKGGLNG